MQPATLGGYVFDELLQKICNGGFRQGQKLPSEAALAEEYGVSRPVIRTAIQRLRNQGLVETTKGLGSFVCRTSVSCVIQMSPVDTVSDTLLCYEYRAAVEGEIAYHAARRCNAADRIRIQKAFEASESAFSSNDDRALLADLQFHLAIAEASHNRFYIQALQTIKIQMTDGMNAVSDYFVGNKARHNSIKSMEHSLILEAIQRGDGSMAKAAMRLHIERSKNWLSSIAR